MLDWDDPPFAKWVVGGRLNAASNCVDRHVEEGRGDKVAFHFVGEPVDADGKADGRDITYAERKDLVPKAANALLELGVETGDRMAIYMPMVPEAVVAMLACGRGSEHEAEHLTDHVPVIIASKCIGALEQGSCSRPSCESRSSS